HQIEKDFFSAGRMKNILRCSAHFCDLNRDACIAACIFFSQFTLNLLSVSMNRGNVFFIGKDLCDCLSGDRVVLLAAFHGNDLIFSFSLKAIEESSHKNIGVGAFLVNLGSGMSTHKTADLHLDLLAFRLHSLYRNPADRGKSACTADPEAAFRLGVKIDQSLSFQHAAVQAYRTKKSDLFFYGDQNLQSRMRNIITVKKRKTVCNSDSVVAAQGGSVCRNKSVFYGNIQTVFCEIMIHVRSFFTYHIHMSLDDH